MVQSHVSLFIHAAGWFLNCYNYYLMVVATDKNKVDGL